MRTGRHIARYAFALAAVGAALLLRVALTQLTGPGLATYITFTPAIMIVALVAGLGPGLAATLAAAVVVDYFVLVPTGSFKVENLADAVGLALLIGMGILMSVFSQLYHQSKAKLAAYEKGQTLPAGGGPSGQSIKIYGGFILAIITLATIAWFSLNSMKNEAVAIEWTSHTYDVTDRLDQLLAKLVDAETGERGFIITGDEKYLQPYNNAMGQIDAALAALGQLTADNPVEQKHLEDIVKLSRDKEAEMKKTIELRRTVGFEAASREVSTHLGKALMDKIRDIVADMRAEELRLLGQRKTTRETAAASLYRVVLVGSIISLCFIVTVFIFLRQENARRLRIQKELEQNRDQLEETVAARTVMLSRSNDQLKEEIEARQESQESLAKLNSELEQRVAEQVAQIRKANETLEHRIADRTQELQSANETLRTSRLAALNLMEDAVEARKQAELAQERLDLALRSANMGVWRYEIAENKRYFDDQTCYVLGINPGAFAGSVDDFFSVVHPDDRPKLKMAMAQTTEKNIPYEPEYRVIWPDESVHHIAARGKLTRDEHGQPLRINGVIWDITERKRVEAMLQSRVHLSEMAQRVGTDELLQAVLDEAEAITGSQIGFFHFVNEDQENLTLQAWSTNTLQNMCKAEGKGQHYPISQAGVWADCFHARKPVIHNNYAAMPGKKGMPEGHAPVVRELVVPIMRGETVIAIVGVGNKDCDYTQTDADIVRDLASPVMDMVTRKRAEEALRRSEQRYRSLFEQAAVGIKRLSPEGHILEVNDKFCDILGYTHDELLQLSLKDFTYPEDLPIEQVELTRLLSGQISNYSFEKRCVRKDGKLAWIRVTSSLASASEGAAPWWISVVEDITERKEAQEALQKTTDDLARSNKELEQFAYIASHDLQEPLRVITGYIQLIAKRYTGRLDNDADDFINFAVDGANRMQNLITDLLAYSRVTRKAKPFAEVDSNLLLAQALLNLDVAIKTNDALVTNDPLPIIMADGTQIMQLFQNLVGNAVKFHGKTRPEIHISCKKGDGEWIFSVKDNGIGIESAYKDRIFVIFQRLHSREEYAGTGIGLAICKKIVERHNGQIWLDSVPGEGSTFYFTIKDKGE